MDFWLVLFIFDWILFVIIAGTVLYMGVFAVAALFHSKPEIPKAKRMNRFVILIPAYKQDKVIEQTVLAALSQAYPQRMFDVTVISDHQEELTNMRLAQYPITLLIPNFEESTKAKSLQYAILNLPEFKIYDAVIILDGDNIIDQDFLDQVNDAYEIAATKAIQTHRISKNRDTAAARMDAIFEEINNAIFRRGHISCGLSAALAGSGTVFDFNWYKTNVMRTKTSGEDKELEALLMRQDIFVDYFDNIYGDIHNRNIAKPKFKEKLRLRSYGGDKPIFFLEFKDKVLKNVYKRRIYLSKEEVDAFVNDGVFPPKNGDPKHDEFIDELAIFKERYRGSIVPNTIMQYDRVAYMNKPGEDYLRLTVDRDIRYRREDFEINKIGGKSLLKEGYGILEIKFIGAMPLFVAKALNDLGLQRQTFSKFGSSYLNEAKEARLL